MTHRWAATLPVPVARPLPARRSAPDLTVRPEPESGLYLGRALNANGLGGDRVEYPGPLHAVLFGPNGVGKGMRVLAPNLLSMEGKSIVVIDPKGQLAAMTAAWRHYAGNDVRIIDPFGVLRDIVRSNPHDYRYLEQAGLVESAGFNPLARLDPDGRSFFDDAAVIGEALIKIQGNDPHWTESAQGLVDGLVMWERRENGPRGSLENVRRLLTEPEELSAPAEGRKTGHPIRGLRFTAAMMASSGVYELESLAGRFLKEHTDEIESIVSTADTQTRWLLSRPVREDLKKDGVNFADLMDYNRKPTTVYVILPSDQLEKHSVWLRLVVSEALRACMKPGGRRVLLMLDEFAALGHLSIVQKLFGVVRDYRVQMWPVFQDLPQLKSLYSERWETLLGMAGVVQSSRCGDLTTAQWMSDRSPRTTATALSVNFGTSSNDGKGGTSSGYGYSQFAEATIKREAMFGLPDEHSVCWFAGHADPAMLYMPHLRQLPRLFERACTNPYYFG